MVIFKRYGNSNIVNLSNINDNLFGPKHKFSGEPTHYHYSPEEIEYFSLCRTKRRIKEIALCNDFEYFATMTVSSKIEQFNRFDLENCVDNCKKFMKKLKRKSADFKFIYIIEEHKKGGYHFHGFMKNLPVGDIYKNDNGYLSSHILDDLGYNSFSRIKNYEACCNYIKKYITKNCCRTDNNQIYFCSRGLEKPQQEFMLEKNLDDIFFYINEKGEKVSKVYSDKWCQTYDFQFNKLSQKELLLLNDYFKENDEYFEKNSNITNWLQLLTQLKNYNKINIH